MTQEKPGYKTTEFYLTLLVTLLGAFMASGTVADGHWSLQVAGMVMSVLGALGYTASRGKAKLAAAMERAETAKAASLGKLSAPAE